MAGEAPPERTLDPARTLDAVDQAVVVTDREGVVRYWNAQAAALYGWTADEAVGRSVLELTLPDHVLGDALAVMDQLGRGRPWAGEMVLRRRGGETFLGRLADTPILDEHGEVVGIIKISEDVTERRHAEASVAATAQRLQLALSAGRLGVWQWDRVTGEVEWDETVEAIYGVTSGGAPRTFEAYVALIHPDDRDETVATVHAAVEDGLDYTVEHRVVWPDGTVRWVQGHGQPIWEDGSVRGLVGVVRDVNDGHEAEAERARLLVEERQARKDADEANDRLTFLAEATRVLSEPADLAERLDRLVRVGVPRFADGSAVHLLDADGEPRLVAFHHREPKWERAVRELIERYPVRLDADTGAGAAIREGVTSWSPAITDEILQGAARDAEHLALLRSLEITANVSVPLWGRKGVLGALSFVTTGGRTIASADVRLAEQLADRAGILIENARLLDELAASAAAHRYQAALLAAIVESSIDGMIAVAPTGEILSYNARYLEMWGFDEDLLARGDAALVEAEAALVTDPERYRARIAEVYATRPPHVRDEVLLADGRTFDRYGATVQAKDGEYLGFAWTYRDVTVDKLRQAEIVAAGERFAALARTLQQSLLPPHLPSPVGIQLAARYHPALDGVEVGGDFYDVFEAGDDWVLVLGDVCGKGARAAALTALIRYTVRAVAMHDSDPASILEELNAVMARNGGDPDEERFATVVCLRLRRTDGLVHVDVACAGHPLPVIVRRGGGVEDFGVPGTIVGVFDTIEVTTASAVLAPGDHLVAVTDGVLEARDRSGKEFDRPLLASTLAAVAGREAGEIAAEVERAALEWEGGRVHDDVAVLVATVVDA